jgi:hypothetical protein
LDGVKRVVGEGAVGTYLVERRIIKREKCRLHVQMQDGWQGQANDAWAQTRRRLAGLAVPVRL